MGPPPAYALRVLCPSKSIRGNARGVTRSVASQFTIITASWLVASRKA
jgi:hypothetical protein